MSISSLSSKDLNLLPVLQMLLEERNVTRAAGRLNLSQPAISRNLSRLRELFNDPLFTRTPKGLTPTPRAEKIALQLQRSLQDLSLLIEPDEFIPAKATTRFRLATTDYGSQVLLPSVIRRLREEAPGVNLEITPWKERFVHILDQQDIDLAVCTVSDAPSMIHGRGVGEDQFVCVVNQSHPLVKQSQISESYLQNYASHAHTLITMGGEAKGAVDHLLEEQGLERRIALRVPHFVAALALVATTDLVLTIPYGLATSCATHYNLKTLPLPLRQKPFTYSIIWHERHRKDPGHIWFRQLVYEELSQTIRDIQARYVF
ncbi:LysR family transcriptional regulator [Parendozoicomonas sp. Alg238-R29]|uniref:LysR family transcriptional regulator n=1 Tax=Parendozoicomonas sp. Alg238-R29 TaxID=2993446 RepID=UPI00248D522B|nr:LysR family transcriptional regulator [Parendozoicomonas sp. Alg238-R29]